MNRSNRGGDRDNRDSRGDSYRKDRGDRNFNRSDNRGGDDRNFNKNDFKSGGDRNRDRKPQW